MWRINEKNYIISVFFITSICLLFFLNLKKKNTSKYKDYDNINSLKLEQVSTEILVKFNGNLYGKSYSVIDYMKNPNGRIGIINKLIDEEYIPKYDGETNKKELVNAIIDSVSEYYIVLNYNNEYVLFEKIEY